MFFISMVNFISIFHALNVISHDNLFNLLHINSIEIYSQYFYHTLVIKKFQRGNFCCCTSSAIAFCCVYIRTVCRERYCRLGVINKIDVVKKICTSVQKKIIVSSVLPHVGVLCLSFLFLHTTIKASLSEV